MAADDSSEEFHFHAKFREEEEMEFYTELALHETERWITVRLYFSGECYERHEFFLFVECFLVTNMITAPYCHAWLVI